MTGHMLMTKLIKGGITLCLKAQPFTLLQDQNMKIKKPKEE